MGLDMYLDGRDFMPFDKREEKDGFLVKGTIYDLGYWRKHPNLHGYIVKNFAKDGIDDCSEIHLEKEDLEKILHASETDQLGTTTGFFFGTSQPEDKEETKKILTHAIDFLESSDGEAWREVYYTASW